MASQAVSVLLGHPVNKCLHTFRGARSRATVGAAALLVALASPRAARAEPLVYRPVSPASGSPDSSVDIPYTFGTHHFVVREVHGALQVEWGDRPAVSGRLAVPIGALRGGGDTLDCHMRESLGIDYRRSSFPASHVCSGGKLPESGNDAVAYPDITFDVTGVVPAGGRLPLVAGQRIPIVVLGRWTIHGVSHEDRIDARLTLTLDTAGRPRTVRVEAVRKILLADYGIVVKRALVITAGEAATVSLNVMLRVAE